MGDVNKILAGLGTNFRSYLGPFRVKPKEPFTHTSMSPAASYYVSEDDIDTFWKHYCNIVIKGFRPTLTEKPGAYGPLRFDFDLKSSLDDGLKRKYTKDTIKRIIGIIQSELINAIAPEDYDDKLVVGIVLEKKAPRVDEGRIKDGFHFHFPNFICEGWFQDEYMRTKVTERMIKEKVWDGIKYNDPVEKFIDTGMARKQWLMYGSSKAEGAEPFLMTRAYDHNLEEVTIAQIFADDMVGRPSRVSYYLPQFLSIRGHTESTPLKPDVDAKRNVYKPRKAKAGIIVKKRSAEDVMEDIKLIQEGKIMEMLSDERADEYDSWIDVGWTLFNIGQGCEETLAMWVDFSRRSTKFVEGVCEDQWAKMEMRDKTIGSLLAMAKTDDPDRFKEWKEMNVKTFIKRSLYEDKPNEWDVAQVVHKLYRDRFVCADAKKDVWYEFINHRWQHMDDNVSMKKLLATEVVNTYYLHKSMLSTQQNTADDATRPKLEAEEKKCREIITALKTVVFQEKLIKMCKLVFYDGTFLKKADENKLLFVCENGVLDLELLLFRDGRPDDYCTLSSNVVFPKNATVNDDGVIEVDDYLSKVFTNPRLKQYFKDTASAAMEGGNVNKTFIVGTGSGDNAKTVTYSFLEMAFGDYCIKFPRELFVVGKGNSSGGARPELARVRGRRLAIVSEIAKTETMNIGVLKELTGNDSFFARGMYEKGTDIKPCFTLWMQCVHGNTAISLPGGISAPMKQLSDNPKVISWDAKTGGLKATTQKRFLRQGTKKCVKLTMKDGTSIECTPDHRLLDKDGKWIEAQDIEVGKTQLTMGQHQPCYNDLTADTAYNFLDGLYNMNTINGKLKAMAVCRLLGYGLADGCMNRVVFMGHKIDAETVVEDIFLLTGKRPTISKTTSAFQIAIPAELQRQLSALCSPQPGGRLNNPMVLPEFIFDPECPDFLVRELLAGMFGGDGVIPCISKSGKSDIRKMFSPMRYIASKINKYIPSLIDQFERIVELLRNRFGIEAMVEKPLEYEPGKSRVQLNINKSASVKTFIEKIGVRYCCHKAYRLTAVLSYYKYKTSIAEQNERIVNRAKELVDIYTRENPNPKIMQFGQEGEYIATYGTTQEAQHATGINHSLINGACKRSGMYKGYIWRYHYEDSLTEDGEEYDEVFILDGTTREVGCETLKKAMKRATNEEAVLYCPAKIVTYTQLCHRLAKGEDYTQQQNGDLMTDYLNETGLINFCNTGNGNDNTYAVPADAITLPCYHLTVIGREDAGYHEVYDLTVEEPYSNYVSNSMVSHNCNEPPKVPGHDDATWNRIRVIDYESKFVKGPDLGKFPVPESEAEQIKMKRFKADHTFMRRLPELAPYLLWTLFENYKQYKTTGLREPEEVFASTNNYRAENDVYAQFVDECIHKATPEELALDEKHDKYFLKLSELHTTFTDWFHLNHSSYAKDKFSKIILMKEFNKKLPGTFTKKGKMQGWYGYELVQDDGETAPPTTQTRKLPSVKAAASTTTAPKAGAKTVVKVSTATAPKVGAKTATKATVGESHKNGAPQTKIIINIPTKNGETARVITPREPAKSIVVRPVPKSKIIRV